MFRVKLGTPKHWYFYFTARSPRSHSVMRHRAVVASGLEMQSTWTIGRGSLLALCFASRQHPTNKDEHVPNIPTDSLRRTLFSKSSIPSHIYPAYPSYHISPTLILLSISRRDIYWISRSQYFTQLTSWIFSRTAVLLELREMFEYISAN